MTTIAKLVIEMMAEPTGIKTGLDKAEGYLRQFGKTADQALASAGRGAAGTVLADNIIGQLQSKLQAGANTVREQLFRSILSPQAAATHAREAALAMNTTILATLSELRTRGLATPEIEHMLISQLSDAGLKAGTAGGERAGRSFAQTLTATIHRHRALIPTIAGLVLGQLAGNVSEFANAENKIIGVGKAAEKMLESVAMLASFLLKPIPGLIAAVIGGALAAMVGMFVKAKEDLHTFAKAVKKELDDLINAVDQLGLEKRLKVIELGQPSGGLSKLAPGAFGFETDEKGFFKAGLKDLVARQAADIAALEKVLRSTPQGVSDPMSGQILFSAEQSALQKSIDARQKLIDQAVEQQQAIRQALLNPLGGTTGFGGQLPPVKTTALAPSAEFKDALKSVKDLISAEKQLADLHQLETPVGLKLTTEMVQAQDQLMTQLAALQKTDPFGEMATSIGEVIVQLDAAIDRVGTLRNKEAIINAILARPIPGVAAPIPRGKEPFSLEIVDISKWKSRTEELVGAMGILRDRLKDTAVSGFFAALRSIAGQLNPFLQIISAINTSAAPLVPVMTSLANIVGHSLGPVFEAFAPVLTALLPLFDALLRVLAPILRALAPLFEAFIPILNALFPIIKGVAIAFTYVVQAASFLAGILFNIAGGIAVAIGGLIAAIGTMISKIPFLGGVGRDIRDFGNMIKNLGHGFEQTANGLFETADQMAKARDEINGVNIDPAQTALDSLGDAADTVTAALLNVPTGYKVALARFNATTPRTPLAPRDNPPVSPSGGGGSHLPGGSGDSGGGGGGDGGSGGGDTDVQHTGPTIRFDGDIVIHAGERSASDLADEMLTEMRRRARAQLGNASLWSQVQV